MTSQNCHDLEIENQNDNFHKLENVFDYETNGNVGYRSILAGAVREVWLNVFQKLDESDKTAFFRADAKWNDWVASKRTLFLIPEVGPILLKTLPKTVSLQCRELCRSWTKELDHLVQTHSSHLCIYSENDEVSTIPKQISGFYFADWFQKFHQDMKTHQGNPFPGRTIDLDWYEPEEEMEEEELVRLCEDYWLNATQFCEKYGAHVHDITIDTFDSCLTGMEMIGNVSRCLLYLPNLKKLHLSGIRNADGSNSIRDYFRMNTLPQLANLETLEVKETDGTFLDVILSSCCLPSKIKRLFLLSTYSMGYFEDVFNFVNLEVLEVDLYIQNLQQMADQELVPPLSKLYLKFLNKQVSAVHLFNALEPFSDSLTQFKMKEPSKLVVPHAVDLERIKLPKLERLYIFKLKGSVDFVLQLTSLTHLEIVKSKIEQEHLDGCLVKFYGHEKRMYESNIWELLPSLQTLLSRVTISKNSLKNLST
ncbi:hypothetical protein Ocin01_15659 [Orchesella cincta]|uniref:F-box domain-containing protein n=1 Tax=Orchesella cincta TaxID=48709 RepID=A0A1D2MDT4_ORCCI|nr:hypothetical protein Ocin01_15659 [Orchesella cincta]